MSYILDALNKADAKRGGNVPDLHSRSAHAVGPEPTRSAGLHPGWWWLLACLGVAGTSTALWWVMRGEASTPAVPAPQVAQVAQAPRPSPAATSAPVGADAPPKPAPATAVAPPASDPRLAKAASAAVAQPAVPARADKAASAANIAKANPPRPKPAPTPAPKIATPVNEPAASAPTTPPRSDAPLLSALNPAVRSQLPTLAVGGSVYSPQASARFVVINGQVLREGDKLSEGLTVETIGAKGSVLNWQGTRFQLPH